MGHPGSDRAPSGRPQRDPADPVADARLGDLFEALEQQAAGLDLTERDAELADRARGEYATVTLGGRVHASVGRPVRLRLVDGTSVEGALAQAGRDWCGLSLSATAGGSEQCVVRFAGIAMAEGLSSRALPEAARPALARLGFGSALHRCAGDSRRIVLRLLGGQELGGLLHRVGADFVEVLSPAGPSAPGSAAAPAVAPFSAVVAAWAG